MTIRRDVRGIDIHTHVMRSIGQEDTRLNPAEEAIAATFRGGRFLDLLEMAEYYRQRNLALVAFTVDDRTRSGQPPGVSAEEIALAVVEHGLDDVVIPFTSVDPHRGVEALRDVERHVRELGCRGVKLHPSQQGFYPDDRQFYPLYETITELGVPIIVHSGQTAVGRGQRGGGGIRLKYSDPMRLDDVAVDHPDLDIVIAHPSFPWQDEAIAVALHKPNVYIDLSGWAPKYFPPQLVRYARTQLQDKVLFGSDYPAITPDRWFDEFAAYELPEDVFDKIVRRNAARLLGLELGTD
ncbi:amidohydrolase family protein [Georgenia sp. Z1344]|uniref:amidohydrolase family protein n=1 Tax=Georgenia sp. Z1344 TaxID=3416706 RepID=UPI003CE7319D